MKTLLIVSLALAGMQADDVPKTETEVSTPKECVEQLKQETTKMVFSIAATKDSYMDLLEMSPTKTDLILHTGDKDGHLNIECKFVQEDPEQSVLL